MSARRLDASALRDWAHTAVGDLISHTDEINRLNVFPVADADTGTNMLFTMRVGVGAGRRAVRQCDDVTQVAAALATGALHGARGNSGVILSQILRGLADVVLSVAADRGGVWPTSTAPFSRRRCGTRSGWSSRRWASPYPAPSSRCCRTPRAPPRMPAPTAQASPTSSPRLPTPPPSHSTRRPANSTCWPRPAWWMPAAVACWYCWTR